MKFDHYNIRFLHEEDLNDYFELIENNRSRLEDFFAGTVSQTKTLEDTRNHLYDVLQKYHDRNYFPFVVIDESNGKMISSIQVKSIDWSIPKAELGYYIDSAYEGKGIVAKAVRLIIDYCFTELKLNKLYIRTHAENISSIRIAEKNGFTLEGIIRMDYKTSSGKVVDLMYYGLLREDPMVKLI
jgi:RimJ/RimL family protein N-acetyltransferase